MIIIQIQLSSAQVTKEGITVKLIDNTDYCDEYCYSVYNVCGEPILDNNDIRFDFRTPYSNNADIKNLKVITTFDSHSSCYDVKVEGYKNRFQNVDNIPTFKGVMFDEFTWWNTSWYYCINVTINHNYIDKNLTNFPVTLFLNDSIINYTYTKDLGQDIRVVDNFCYNSGSIVPYEIERWNESGTSIVHFKASFINSDENTIYSLYYYNPAATDSQNISSVWDNNYLWVLHMNNNQINIDSKNYHNGTCSPSCPISSDGYIDGALQYSNNHGSSHGDYMDTTTNLTIEAMASVENPSAYKTLVAKYNFNLQMSYIISLDDNGASYFCLSGNGQTSQRTCDDWTGSFDDNVWYYVVGRYRDDNDNMTIDVDLSPKTSATHTYGLYDSNANFTVGLSYETGSPTGFYEGKIDEVRVSNSFRSDEWIKATYYSLKNQLVVYGSLIAGPELPSNGTSNETSNINYTCPSGLFNLDEFCSNEYTMAYCSDSNTLVMIGNCSFEWIDGDITNICQGVKTKNINCENGCYDELSYLGSGCAPTDIEILAITGVVMVLFIAALGFMLRTRGR
jgi:hypothetical protein